LISCPTQILFESNFGDKPDTDFPEKLWENKASEQFSCKCKTVLGTKIAVETKKQSDWLRPWRK